MLKDIITTGGSSYLIPAVLFALVLYGVRGLFTLHGRRSQHRKEFLELWAEDRQQDDVWLQVAVRHLVGTYPPAPVIRLALTRPDACQGLLELSELWSLLRYDADRQIVAWRRSGHETNAKRRAARLATLIGYVAFAVVAAVAGLVAAKSGPGTFAGWIAGVWTVLAGALSFICLTVNDKLEIAIDAGSEWVDLINRAASRSPAHDELHTSRAAQAPRGKALRQGAN